MSVWMGYRVKKYNRNFQMNNVPTKKQKMLNFERSRYILIDKHFLSIMKLKNCMERKQRLSVWHYSLVPFVLTRVGILL